MKNTTLLTVIFISFLISKHSQSQVIVLDSTAVVGNEIITGLDVPWEIQWGPDNFIWTTERYGRVSRIDPANGNQDIILDLSNTVYASGESGLLGLALHPDFNNTSEVFLAYTYLDGLNITEKLVKYAYNGSDLINPTILIDGIQGNITHVGARLLFLEDTTLLMTTGDAQNQSSSQDISNLSGKVLRLNPDGSIPNDNPIPDSYVWSWGHRNAQGLCHGPNGIIFSSEHGPTTDDEINQLEVAQNYGWPNVHGYCDEPNETVFCNDSNVYEPDIAWTPTLATSDIVWYNSDLIPEFQNTLLLTTLKNKDLHSIKYNNDFTSIESDLDFFNEEWGRLRDICMAPDGRLFLATNGQSWSNTEPFTHSIIEIKPQGYIPINISKVVKQKFNWFINDQSLSISSDHVINEVEIYDLSGKVIYHSINSSNQFHLNLDHMSKGLYILKMKGSHSEKSIKIVL